jgi:hypothetical protein
MPRRATTPDPWSSLVGILAEALAARLDFPPRASSASAARAARAGAAPARPVARHRRRKRSPALAERLTDALVEALAAQLDFPPRASSAAAARVAPAPAGARPEGRRRAPARPSRLSDELLAYVGSHPGERIEQIAGALRRPASGLAPAARDLVAQGKIRTRGAGRAARYCAA